MPSGHAPSPRVTPRSSSTQGWLGDVVVPCVQRKLSDLGEGGAVSPPAREEGEAGVKMLPLSLGLGVSPPPSQAAPPLPLGCWVWGSHPLSVCPGQGHRWPVSRAWWS